MEALNQFYLNDPYFLLAAKNAQPYPIQQNVTSTAPNVGNKVLEFILTAIALGLIGYAVNRFLSQVLEKDQRKEY